MLSSSAMTDVEARFSLNATSLEPVVSWITIVGPANIDGEGGHHHQAWDLRPRQPHATDRAESTQLRRGRRRGRGRVRPDPGRGPDRTTTRRASLAPLPWPGPLDTAPRTSASRTHQRGPPPAQVVRWPRLAATAATPRALPGAALAAVAAEDAPRRGSVGREVRIHGAEDRWPPPIPRHRRLQG
jgi:hypothetical protein